jgi:P-type Na+/K+ transporter
MFSKDMLRKKKPAAEAEFEKHPFLLSVAETARALGTSTVKGLTAAQVRELQGEYPENELEVGGTVPWHKILTKQLLNAMILVCSHPAPPPAHTVN